MISGWINSRCGRDCSRMVSTVFSTNDCCILLSFLIRGGEDVTQTGQPNLRFHVSWEAIQCSNVGLVY